MRRVAVIGHVEWVGFIEVTRHPARGELVQAKGAFTRAAGGGAVAAAVLAQLGAQVDFFCALGQDQHGAAAAAELEALGIEVHAAWREQPTRRAVTLLEDRGERTIVTIGQRLEPAGTDDLAWSRLVEADGAYVTAGDSEAFELARRARVLVSTPRARTAAEADEVGIDALVFSAADRDEREWAQLMESRIRLMVATEGDNGGHWWGESAGRWTAVPPPGEPHDTYGCGDSFAAGLTFGLAAGLPILDATAVGARCGALALTRPGAP